MNNVVLYASNNCSNLEQKIHNYTLWMPEIYYEYRMEDKIGRPMNNSILRNNDKLVFGKALYDVNVPPYKPNLTYVIKD